MADLIITDMRWEPANPKKGDKVEFFATIKNCGDVATPAKIKHGIAFSVNGAIDGTWSDGYKGDAAPGLAPGESIELSTRMDGSSGALWTVGVSAAYTIKAHVNDQNEIPESITVNNFFEKVLSVSTGIDGVSADSGNVFYANGVLNVVGYPADAVISVYSLLGQTISGNLLSGNIVNLPSGIIVVKVQSEGKTYTHKVIVK